MTNDSGKGNWPILKKIGYGILLTIGLFVAYLAYISWEVSEIKQLCREVVPGTSISEMESLINMSGGYWFKAGSGKIGDEKNMWVETVCAKSTMCETSCRIYHNETEVTKVTLR